MNKKKDEGYLNYLLTLGFILLIVIFIVSIVLISRIVFTDSTSIGEHVINTKDLLEDISDVKQPSNNTLNIEDLNIVKYNDLEISDISFHNINENKSVLTVFLNNEIETNEGYYYMKIKNIENLKKGANLVYYNTNGDFIDCAFFVDFNKENLILTKDDEKIIDIEKDKILGKFIYVEE